MRSLSTTERYLQLIYALQKIDLDVLGLSEVKRMGCNIEEYSDYILCYIGQTKGLHGVGFLVKKIHKNKITNFTGISERVALLQLKINTTHISIIQAYAPTEDSSEDEILKFYIDIEEAYSLTDDKVIVVMGDFNAKIGWPTKEENLIMGEHGYGKRNERGERLINFALENKLSIMNTFFKKKASRKWTWLSPNQKTKNEIDFIMTNSPRLITNFEVLTHITFASDHKLLRATFVLKEVKKSRTKFRTLPKNLKSEKEIKNYTNCLRENVEVQLKREPTDIQTYYNKIEKVILDSLQMKDATPNKANLIFSETTKQLIKKRTELIHTKNKSRDQKKQLSKLFKETNKSIKKDYNNYRQDIITRNLNSYRSTKRALKELNFQKTWIGKLERNIEETKTRKDVLNHATEFYKQLYTKRKDESLTEEQINDKTVRNPIRPIEEKEVYKHLKQLKNLKSPGPDGITNEVIKLGAPILLNHLTRLFNMILEMEIVPKQWCTSDITLLYKKGNPKDIGNYRPISLLASTYKLFTSIILERITREVEASQPIEQAGFRSNFSTTDHIQALEQVMEKYKEFNKPLYVAFIDYSKAFDSISHISIWDALKMSNVDHKYINIIKNIYENSTSKVKLETRGDPIKIERGVRQGDPLSPKLFIAVLENIFRNLDWTQKGIKIDNQRFNHLRFADDIVLMAETHKELEYMIDSLHQESTKTGLEMNASKTKLMTNSFKYPITVQGKNIEYVNNYIYLGKQVSFTKTNNEEEVERRINITWKKYWSLKEILKGNYSLKMKRIVMDTCLLPCLLYGCQTWVFTNKIKQKIRTTQRAMERSILKIRKIHKISSEIIRKRTKLMDALTQALTLKWRWAGHISRYSDNRWTLQATKWKGPAGKRRVGRPNRRWADDIVQIAGKDWMTLGKNREAWNKLEEAFTRKGVLISE